MRAAQRAGASRAEWRVNSQRSGEFPQGQFICPEDFELNGVPGRWHIGWGIGGTDVLKLDNALATVDDFVHEKLGL